jgi:hypothetical protein
VGRLSERGDSPEPVELHDRAAFPGERASALVDAVPCPGAGRCQEGAERKQGTAMISFGPKKTLTTDHADNIKAVEELLKASESAGAEGCCSEPDGAQLERVASSREKETPLEAVRRLWAANPGIGVKKMAALVKVEGLPFGTKAVRQALEQVKGEEAVESAPEPAPAPESAPAPAPATVHKEPMSEIEQILERDGTFDEWTPFCEQVHGDVTSLDDPGPYMLCGEGGDVCEGNGWGSGGLQLKSDLRGDFCKEMTMLCKNPYCALGPENMEMVCCGVSAVFRARWLAGLRPPPGWESSPGSRSRKPKKKAPKTVRWFPNSFVRASAASLTLQSHLARDRTSRASAAPASRRRSASA